MYSKNVQLRWNNVSNEHVLAIKNKYFDQERNQFPLTDMETFQIARTVFSSYVIEIQG